MHIIFFPSPFALCYYLFQVVKNWASFALSLHIFIGLSRKMSVSLKKILLYNYVDSPPYFCTHFVSLFNCVDIFNINVHFLFVRFVLLFIFTIILHFIASLGFCSDVFIILWLVSHRQIVSIWCFFKCSSQFTFQILNPLVSIKEIIDKKFLQFLMTKPMILSKIFINKKYLWRNWIGFFIFVLLLGLTH